MKNVLKHVALSAATFFVCFQAHAAVSQSYVEPRMAALPVDACVEEGSLLLQDHEDCGMAANQFAADAFCQANGFPYATSWQLGGKADGSAVSAHSFGMEMIAMGCDNLKIVHKERLTQKFFTNILCDGRKK